MANDNAKGESVQKATAARPLAVNLFGTNALQSNLTAVDPNAVHGNAFDPEDEYQSFYAGAVRDMGVLEPPYRLRQLERLCQENNALGPCIDAMVTNIDGTGYNFEQKEVEDDPETNDDEDDTQIKELRDFFGEPYPGFTFKKIRKLLRRDVERTGNGYIEVIRNPQGDVVFFRHVDAKMMRMVKLDDPVSVDKKVMRRGKQSSVKMTVRERRFCQIVNGVTMVYFREFGSSRDLNKRSGQWAPIGTKLPATVRSTEIIHYTAIPDAHTPYGVPRWISQVPSVLGSRRAEELNLDFFANGGVPPVMVILQGGMLMTETRKRLEQITQQGAMKTNRVAVIEVEATGGDLDSSGSGSKVTVERFGAERQQDSMFENYDGKCEERVRRAFRLPPIFVGAADSYTFATAFASYTVAEAQVFKPERDDFDETITMGLMAEMGYANYRLTSKPLVIEDGTLKLQGIELGLSTSRVDFGDAIKEINEATGTNLKLMAPDDPANPDNPASKAPPSGFTTDNEGNLIPVNPDPQTPSVASAKPSSTLSTGAKPGKVASPTQTLPGQATPKPANGGAGRATPVNSNQRAAARKGDFGTIAGLAKDAMTAMRNRDSARLGDAMAIVAKLDDTAQAAFKKACAELHFIDTTLDADGLIALSGCTMALLAQGRALKFDKPAAKSNKGKGAPKKIEPNDVSEEIDS